MEASQDPTQIAQVVIIFSLFCTMVGLMVYVQKTQSPPLLGYSEAQVTYLIFCFILYFIGIMLAESNQSSIRLSDFLC